ncbi:MAG: carboxypeptidase regulatory-like domain-containing protein [Acidobacteriota bacterium]
MRFAPPGLFTLVVLALLSAACSPAAPADAPPAAPVAPAGPVSETGLATVLGTAVPGAIVTLHPAEARDLPAPAGPAVMDQLGKQFVPGTLVARVGQPVEFRNSEDQSHNVRVVRRRVGTAVFDVSTDPFQRYTHVFDTTGEFEVTCNLHPGMNASVIITDTPYAAAVDNTGRYAIVNVPPGSYRLAVSASGEVRERTVQVAAPQTDVDAPAR